MLNPLPSQVQGYDSEYVVWSGNRFDPGLNVAMPNGETLSPENPLTIPGNSSLISSISLPDPGYGNVIVKTAAVLTVLDSPAPENSFRPGYAGQNKKVEFTADKLNYSRLSSTPEAMIMMCGFNGRFRDSVLMRAIGKSL